MAVLVQDRNCSIRTDSAAVTRPLRWSGVAIAVLFVAGCEQPHSPALSPEVRRPQRAAVLCFVDGMDRVPLTAMLDAGELPNIQRYFIDGGVSVDRAIVSIPAVTYANAVSIVTGRFPGHHGVLGNRWFDRDSLVVQDYGWPSTYRSVNEDFDAPTIFDAFRDRFTINVQTNIRRGVKYTIDGVFLGGIDWGLGNYSGVDLRVGHTAREVIRVAERVGEWPTIWTNYFPGVDEIAHRYGCDSPRYMDGLRAADASIGRIVAAVRDAGMLDSTYFVLVTDHGHVPQPVDHTFDVVGWLRKSADLKVFDAEILDGDFVQRHRTLERYDAVVVNGAYRRAVIHLRGKDGWSDRPSEEAVESVVRSRGELPQCERDDAAKEGGEVVTTALFEHPAVALIAVREGPHAVRLISRNGESRVERRINDGRTEYQLVADGDGTGTGAMLGYRDDAALVAFVDSGWHESRDWLVATASTAFPDLVPQIVETFDLPRAGDVVLFADGDWGFGTRQRGGHGSCLASDMRVPMFFAGPGLPAGGTIERARLVDVAPTVVELIGDAERVGRLGEIDGVSIAAELRAATARPPGTSHP